MNIRNSILLLVAVMVTGISTTYAQDAGAKKTYTKVVDASADHVWTVLRKMDQIDKYTQNVARVEWSGNMGVGGTRKCFAPEGQGYFKENIALSNCKNLASSFVTWPFSKALNYCLVLY